ncbi:hypothetical protein KUA25_04570 [Bacteroidales bacterium MSK.15.36]|nr:hypothetical protein [Bacteroidales bacterium MSK.15.36]
MIYEEYAGDYNLHLEGEPEEIIWVLKYLDGIEDENKGAVIKDDKGNFIACKDGSFMFNTNGIFKKTVNKDEDFAIKIADELIAMADTTVLNSTNDEIVLYMGGKEIGRIPIAGPAKHGKIEGMK